MINHSISMNNLKITKKYIKPYEVTKKYKK